MNKKFRYYKANFTVLLTTVGYNGEV